MENDLWGHWFLPPALEKEIEWMDAWNDSLHVRILLGMSRSDADADVERVNSRIAEWPRLYCDRMHPEDLQELADKYSNYGRGTVSRAWKDYRTARILTSGPLYKVPTITEIFLDSESSCWRLYNRFLAAEKSMQDVMADVEADARTAQIKQGLEELVEAEIVESPIEVAEATVIEPEYSRGYHLLKWLCSAAVLGISLGAVVYDSLGRTHIIDFIAPVAASMVYGGVIGASKPAKRDYEDEVGCGSC